MRGRSDPAGGGAVVAAALSLLAAAVHGRTVAYPFVILDDEALIAANPAVQEGLSWAAAKWALATELDAGWIPLTWLSRLLDVSLFGMDARGHHLVNVLLHGANASLLFAALRRLTGRTWESAFAAALFAAHPLHVESVAWVTERKDVLSGLFWMLGLLSYARYAERPGAGRYGVLSLCFVLSLLSKPTAVTFPFVLLLLDFWPLGRLRLPGGPEGEGRLPAVPPGRLLLEKLPLFLLSAAVSVVTLRFQGAIGAIEGADALPASARLANALLSYGLYLRRAVLPSGLSAFYPHPGAAVSHAPAAAVALLLAAGVAWAVRERGSRPCLPVGLLWFLGVLVPMSGLVQAGGQGMADRCAYLPMVGLYASLSFGAAEGAARLRLPPAAPAAAASLLLLALSLAAYRQAGYWRDSGTLLRPSLGAVPAPPPGPDRGYNPAGAPRRRPGDGGEVGP